MSVTNFNIYYKGWIDVDAETVQDAVKLTQNLVNMTELRPYIVSYRDSDGVVHSEPVDLGGENDD